MKDFINKQLLKFKWYSELQEKRKLKKKLEELKKRDPFIYK